MSQAEEILAAADSILLVDWPTRDVPEALVRAGYTVVVKGGPEPDNYSVYELRDGEVLDHPAGHPPTHADLVYSYRPVSELPGIIALARQFGATAVWSQSGLAGGGAKDPHGCWTAEATSRQARAIVESAGLTYVETPYIADAVRQRGIRK
ncbi:MAG TPA: CoA-binding protein [Streptosporangiaceae bacterium]|nr:CoA-binding protein [Streptosporangiaceae bacterium]